MENNISINNALPFFSKGSCMLRAAEIIISDHRDKVSNHSLQIDDSFAFQVGKLAETLRR
jgi:hypothetical protein